MTVEDLKNQIKEAISTTRRSFKLGEIRMLFVLFVLLLAPAGARPSAILQLRLGDIRLVLARDPEGGPHKILIRFTPCFTKSYLGVKDKQVYLLFLPQHNTERFTVRHLPCPRLYTTLPYC